MELFLKLKKKFTKYLIVFAIILLALNISIDFLKKPRKIENINELSIKQVDSVFLSVLDEYGIKANWIKTIPLKVEEEDSISKQFIVNIPSDLPIPLIIKDINKIIEKDITGFVSEEKKIFGPTEIRIYTNEMLKLKVSLIPNIQTVRDRNKLSFIITDAFELNGSEFNTLLVLPYSLSLLVVPGESVITKVDSLKKYVKEYSVLLNDNINDFKFKLEKGFQKKLLKNSIATIFTSFKSAGVFAVDEKSQLYNSAIYNFVRDEFKKWGVELIKLAEFINLDEANESELISKFKFHCLDGTRSDQKTFLTTYENFRKLRDELEKAKKLGNRVIPLSETELVKRKSK